MPLQMGRIRIIHKPSYLSVRQDMYPGLSEKEVATERGKEDKEYYDSFVDNPNRKDPANFRFEDDNKEDDFDINKPDWIE